MNDTVKCRRINPVKPDELQDWQNKSAPAPKSKSGMARALCSSDMGKRSSSMKSAVASVPPPSWSSS
jgi:hypothetical protein